MSDNVLCRNSMKMGGSAWFAHVGTTHGELDRVDIDLFATVGPRYRR